MSIARVFPRRTNATPDDALAFIGEPPLFRPEVEAVHVSATFTWDRRRAEELADSWGRFYDDVQVGGPAFGSRGGQFHSGRYLRSGYTITSRGCPNRCWFCDVWRRDGDVQELPIVPGWNVLDDNLLACSREHVEAVFDMLERQPRRVEFTGGLEAARLEAWHVQRLCRLRPRPCIWFAFDTPDDEEPLRAAAALLRKAGLMDTSHRSRCYVLIGYPKDRAEDATDRLRRVASIGFTPMAMLWRDESGRRDLQWARLQRQWARPALIHGAT